MEKQVPAPDASCSQPYSVLKTPPYQKQSLAACNYGCRSKMTRREDIMGPDFYGARLSKQLSLNPAVAPTSRFQGTFTLTPGLITTHGLFGHKQAQQATLMPRRGFKGFKEKRCIEQTKGWPKAPLPGCTNCCLYDGRWYIVFFHKMLIILLIGL